MQFADLSARLSLNPKRIREWIRTGIVLPTSPASGRGRHLDYDDVSLVAAAVAASLDDIHVTLTHYERAFGELHVVLRSRSLLEWSQAELDITPTTAVLVGREIHQAQPMVSIRVDLARLCTNLTISERQRALQFGLRSA